MTTKTVIIISVNIPKQVINTIVIQIEKLLPQPGLNITRTRIQTIKRISVINMVLQQLQRQLEP
eukprot:UN21550